MSQVSKFRLRPYVWDRIFDLYVETLISLKNKEQLASFLDDFLSPTERIVYAKRLAIVVLLEKGNSYEEISQILRVTPSTISKMSTIIKYGNGELKNISVKIAKKDKTKAMWEELLSLLDLPGKGLPISEWKKKRWKSAEKVRRLIKEV